MKGIQYVTDDGGKRVAVMIDLKKYAKLWEEFHDSKLMDERLKGPFESLDSVKRKLVQRGKLKA
jgi:hypothetical protein